MRYSRFIPLVSFCCVLFAACLSGTAHAREVDAVLAGDLNEDGSVNIFDLLDLLGMIRPGAQEPSERTLRLADLDSNGGARADIFDLLAMLRVLSGRESPRAVVFSSNVGTVWALGDGEKVFRDETGHFSRDGSTVWDGEKISLAGLFNEVLAFQVIVCADSGTQALGVDITVSGLRHGTSGDRICHPSNTPYHPDGSVELFSEHYITVENPTNPNWFYGSYAARPRRMTGPIPDALIPPGATAGRGGFPLTVRDGELQGFWVDLALPRRMDSGIEPGPYRGSVTVREQGSPVRVIPLELELLPAELPDSNVSTVWLFHNRHTAASFLDEMDPAALDTMFKHIAHRHRIDLVGGFPVHTSAYERDMLDEYLPYIDGGAYTEANGYHGPGQGEGEKLFPIGMYGSAVMGDGRAEVRGQSDLWQSWFAANASGVDHFWYLIDEPGRDMYSWVRERAAWVHDNPGPGKDLPVFITRPWTEELDEAVDRWAGGTGLDVEKMRELKAAGEDHWFYNGYRPRYGSVGLEFAAVDLRMNGWARYIHGVDAWFLWHGNHWIHNHQGPRAHEPQDIFYDPVTFISSETSFGNGDGIVFYPGREPFHPWQDRGLDMVLGSIRLKNIRRGQQDCLIMALAAESVGRETVVGMLEEVVPRAFDYVAREEAVPWSEFGDDYDRVRLEMLEIIRNAGNN